MRLGVSELSRLAGLRQQQQDTCGWIGRTLPDTEHLDPWTVGTETTFLFFSRSFL